MASIGYDRSLAQGRGAPAPRRLGFSGWKDVLFRTFGEVNDDRATLIAAGVTYYLLLAIFPAVTAFVSIYGLFADPATVAKQLDALSQVVPPGGLEIIRDQLTRLTQQGAPTLGLALLISLAVAIWSASSGIQSLFQAMNVAYDEPERRNFFVLTALALGFTLAGVVAAIVMLAVVVALPAVLGIVGFGKGFEWLIQIGGYVVMVLVLLTGIAALYRFGPSRQNARWQWITPGAVLAIVAIGIVSALFSWYAANFGHFDQTYGSLGALIGFLFWMWVCITAVIVGAELNAELERRAERTSAAEQKSRLAAEQAAAFGDHDPRIGKSEDWVAGYEAALSRHSPAPGPRLPVAAAVPAALALGFFRKRRQ